MSGIDKLAKVVVVDKVTNAYDGLHSTKSKSLHLLLLLYQYLMMQASKTLPFLVLSFEESMKQFFLFYTILENTRNQCRLVSHVLKIKEYENIKTQTSYFFMIKSLF